MRFFKSGLVCFLLLGLMVLPVSGDECSAEESSRFNVAELVLEWVDDLLDALSEALSGPEGDAASSSDGSGGDDPDTEALPWIDPYG